MGTNTRHLKLESPPFFPACGQCQAVILSPVGKEALSMLCKDQQDVLRHNPANPRESADTTRDNSGDWSRPAHVQACSGFDATGTLASCSANPKHEVGKLRNPKHEVGKLINPKHEVGVLWHFCLEKLWHIFDLTSARSLRSRPNGRRAALSGRKGVWLCENVETSFDPVRRLGEHQVAKGCHRH